MQSSEPLSVGVVGLGYVGLPLLASFASTGYTVVGLDRDSDKIAQLEATGEPGFYEPGVQEAIARHRSDITFTTDYGAMMRACRAIFITVGTEMREDGTPNLDGVNGCRESIASHLAVGHLIVLKSTVQTGTTRAFARELEKSTGLKAEGDFFVAYWPERTIEGHALHELGLLPKIVGGLGEQSAEMTGSIVSRLGGRVIKVSAPEVAEMCKLVDNSYRAVNIAFANEVGRACEALSINAAELVAAINDGYDRTALFNSGLGAGGPCLSKDPTVLVGAASELGVEMPITHASITSNIQATLQVGEWVREYVQDRALHLPRIALIGLAFKGTPETDDTRGSPASILRRYLRDAFPDAVFVYHDPIVTDFEGQSVAPTITEALDGANVALFLTNHPRITQISSSLIQQAHPEPEMLLVDCWNNLADPQVLVANGTKVYRVGDGTV